MAPSVETLKSQADAIHARYRRGFAGKTRATRSLPELDTILAEMQTLSLTIPSTATALKDEVDGWLKIYKDERDAIAQIVAGGPDALRAWRLVEWAETNFLRYLRDFGGQERLTRDNWLLNEMVARQSKWLEELGPLAAKVKDARLSSQVEQVAKNLDLMRSESQAIPAGRRAITANEYARVLASLANGQFALYRRHFAERPRFSRRPALLRRILGALEDIERGMIAVRDLGVKTDAHLGNLLKVSERVKHHRGELKAIEETRTVTAATQVAGGLGDDANRAFNEYKTNFANRNRTLVDAKLLSDITDRLHEIAAAMDELQVERPVEANVKNLTIVLETVKAYEREWKAIRDAQKVN